MDPHTGEQAMLFWMVVPGLDEEDIREVRKALKLPDSGVVLLMRQMEPLLCHENPGGGHRRGNQRLHFELPEYD
jgi:hypothetical protein